MELKGHKTIPNFSSVGITWEVNKAAVFKKISTPLQVKLQEHKDELPGVGKRYFPLWEKDFSGSMNPVVKSRPGW